MGRGWLVGFTGMVFGLALLHLVPLPPAVWQSIPGRQELVEIENLTSLGSMWRPLTLAPSNGWHAFLSLFAPLAVILLGIQLHHTDILRLLPLVIALAVLSGFLGLLQIIGNPQGPLYLYRITNSGSAVGLFANRNHAATLLACLFPMLAVYASNMRGRKDLIRMRQFISVTITIALVPLILVTGSRSGLVSAIFGLGAGTILYRDNLINNSKSSYTNKWPLFAVSIFLSLACLSLFFSRAEAIERFFVYDSEESGRADFWISSLDLFWKYFPWGAGSGSFAEVYQIVEPTKLLNPYYLNHAHNDWLETAVTFGLPGVIGLSIACIAFTVCTYKLWRNVDSGRLTIVYGRLASTIVMIIGIASMSDYPLRTPLMMGLFAICGLWLTETKRMHSNVVDLNKNA